ncbi:MAG: dipeptidyl peptidase 3 [Acidobacteriia bacterium]|nr:dipeptidyl peptidase 3 [Terriglobia bacterium]
MNRFLTGVAATLLAFGLWAPSVRAQAPATSLVERVGSTGFVQIEAESFNNLSLREKTLAYWLSMAAIAIHPIGFDQNSRYDLRIKHLLEAILTHPQGTDPQILAKITDYAKLFYGNRGHHNAFNSEKFLPEFTPGQLRAAAEQAVKNRARIGARGGLLKELEELHRAIFDPNFEPMLTAKNPPAGQDPLLWSANNLYEDVSSADLKGFTEKYALNSRLVKRNGRLIEEVYRAGTADHKIPPGRYAAELGRAIRYLRNALPYADPPERKALEALIRYYQTGSPADWRNFDIAWVREDSPVDFTNGFIEVYKDVRGMKGAAQAYVTIIDEKMNKAMKALAANAKYFEQREPWADQYKIENPNPPLANAVETVIETGDMDVTTIGENLPNEAEIHDHYGSKSFIFTSSIRALNQATGEKVAEEFAYSPAEVERARQYRELANNLETAMHEVLGHGSGKMNPKLTGEPASYIKEYYSTLEEARADLVALWNFFDPKLIEIGALPNLEVAKAAYDSEARAALTQLHEVPTGDTIEEDHRRGTQLIVNYVREKTGAVEPVERDGKVYMVVKDYDKMRQGVGLLLAELMRIKAEGDYEGAKALITQYGIHFNKDWRDQIVARYKKLDLPSFWAGISPDLIPHYGAGGKIDDVEIRYPRDIIKQQLRYMEIVGK